MLLNSNGEPNVTTTTRGLRWRLMFFLIGPITFVMSLDRTAMVVAAPTIQNEFGFTLVQKSWILTSFSWKPRDALLFYRSLGWLLSVLRDLLVEATNSLQRKRPGRTPLTAEAPISWPASTMPR
jgi:hypothetical protein